VNGVLAGKASNIGAGSADPFPLHNSDALTLFRKSPGNEFGAFAATEHDKVVLLGEIPSILAVDVSVMAISPKHAVWDDHGPWDRM